MVFALMAGIWGLGWAFALPIGRRLIGIGACWLAAIAIHLILPEGAALRGIIGGSAAGWLVLGAGVGLVFAYREGLSRLRARARPVAIPADGPFAAVELERYARHILLREIGGPGQMALKSARVLVVGAGGLGSPALLYLAASGVGVIGVMDDDVVDSSNLQRQIIHSQDRIGMAKVFSAETAMKALNPFVEVRPYRRRFDAKIAAEVVAGYDLVLDGSDNFDTRYLVNRVCVKASKPLISGAITQWEGQLSLFDPAKGGPCYECVFPERPLPGMVPTCAEVGVAAPLPGVIGAMMAMEAVKHLTGAGETLRGRLMIHDALHGETRVIGVKRREDCAVCGVGPE
jgi:molybdopterin/thiamine biosynthesis adenylyltransferase